MNYWCVIFGIRLPYATPTAEPNDRSETKDCKCLKLEQSGDVFGKYVDPIYNELKIGLYKHLSVVLVEHLILPYILAGNSNWNGLACHTWQEITKTHNNHLVIGYDLGILHRTDNQVFSQNWIALCNHWRSALEDLRYWMKKPECSIGLYFVPDH
jgi:hypothetical protein